MNVIEIFWTVLPSLVKFMIASKVSLFKIDSNQHLLFLGVESFTQGFCLKGYTKGHVSKDSLVYI